MSRRGASPEPTPTPAEPETLYIKLFSLEQGQLYCAVNTASEIAWVSLNGVPKIFENTGPEEFQLGDVPTVGTLMSNPIAFLTSEETFTWGDYTVQAIGSDWYFTPVLEDY